MFFQTCKSNVIYSGGKCPERVEYYKNGITADSQTAQPFRCMDADHPGSEISINNKIIDSFRIKGFCFGLMAKA